jgi:hypothetical protein
MQRMVPQSPILQQRPSPDKQQTRLCFPSYHTRYVIHQRRCPLDIVIDKYSSTSRAVVSAPPAPRQEFRESMRTEIFAAKNTTPIHILQDQQTPALQTIKVSPYRHVYAFSSAR